MTDTINGSNFKTLEEFLPFPLVFDIFQLLVISVSLSAGFILLFILPFLRRRHTETIWKIILFGFLHEFYSVIMLIIIKSRYYPKISCVDSHLTTMLVTTYILCSMLSSALKTVTKSPIWNTFLWIYVLCTSYILTDRKVDGSFSDFNVGIKPNYELHLISCNTNLDQSLYLLYEYLLVYFPMLVVFVMMRRHQMKKGM